MNNVITQGSFRTHNHNYTFYGFIATCVMLTAIYAEAQTAAANQGYTVVERGCDYRVWQRTVPVTSSATGGTTHQVQAYQELANGICYQRSDGSWADSQDVVEVSATGAQAVEGPMPAHFNADITALDAISLAIPATTLSPVGLIQSRPLGLFYYDPSLDKVASIGLVQSGRAVLHPPNVLVYEDVIPGLADLMVIWTKGGCEENLVIKQSPPPPESFGLTSAARLQYWSSFNSPAPKEQRPVILRSGLTDHIIIFDSCWLPVGGAFLFGEALVPSPGRAAEIRLTDPSNPQSLCLAKTLVTIAGQKVLIEEINLSDLTPILKTLPQVSLSSRQTKPVEFARRGDLLLHPQADTVVPPAMEVASSAYTVRGLALDPVILLTGGNGGSYTFTAGNTYYIPSSFYLSAATFQANTCIKFGLNARLLTYGPPSFPSSGTPVIFTSKDDNSCGQVVDGSSSEPGYAAAQELWVYYQTVSTTVQNASFRWAQVGAQYDAQSVNQHFLSSSSFQNCNTGVRLNVGGDTFYLSQDTSCNASTPLLDLSDGDTVVVGSITANCGTPTQSLLKNASKLLGCEGEPSIAVNPANPENLFVVANHYAGGTHSTIFGARSSDGGGTWTTVTTDFMSNSYSDPSAAFDRFGNLFVCYIPYPGDNLMTTAVAVLLSTDNGLTFSTLRTITDSGNQFDWPRVTVGPGISQTQSAVWVAFKDSSYLDVTGVPVTGLGAVGSWTSLARLPNSRNYNYVALAVGPGGQVAAAYQQSDRLSIYGPNAIQLSVNPYGLNQNGFVSSTTIIQSDQMGWVTYLPALPYRGVNAEPGLAWDRTGGQYNGRLYMVYTDRPDTTSANTDIYVIYSTDQGITWSPRLKVNNDSTSASQFLPRIAVDQTSGNVAVSWYDCRDDTANKKTKFYAAVSSDGALTFSPNVLLESGQSDANLTTHALQWAQDYLDYTGLAYYGGYFYSAWADNSNTTADNQDFLQGNNEMEIYMGKVGY
ncbi:MAG TPA: sialidase family protein [Verrucomicrobiae bacterium]|nr:sialidase family protein [Verrucomicrobiae bacterium]